MRKAGERKILWNWEHDGKEWYAWEQDGDVWYCELRNDYEWHDKCRVGGALKPLILKALLEQKKLERGYEELIAAQVVESVSESAIRTAGSLSRTAPLKNAIRFLHEAKQRLRGRP